MDVPKSWFQHRALSAGSPSGQMGTLFKTPSSIVHPSSGNESMTIRSAWASLFQTEQFKKLLRSPPFSKADRLFLSFHSDAWVPSHWCCLTPRTHSALHLLVLKTLSSPHFPPEHLAYSPQVRDQSL